NSCAKWTLDLGGSGTCDALELRLGLDGTILQRLPFELESNRDGMGRTKTCTLRFWPTALKERASQAGRNRSRTRRSPMALPTSVVSAKPASHAAGLLVFLVREGEKLIPVDGVLDGLFSR